MGKRSVGRPRARCWNELRKRAGSDWTQKSVEWSLWCALGEVGEAYVQWWTVQADDDIFGN